MPQTPERRKAYLKERKTKDARRHCTVCKKVRLFVNGRCQECSRAEDQAEFNAIRDGFIYGKRAA
jgi:hypothetical protein